MIQSRLVPHIEKEIADIKQTLEKGIYILVAIHSTMDKLENSASIIGERTFDLIGLIISSHRSCTQKTLRKHFIVHVIKIFIQIRNYSRTDYGKIDWFQAGTGMRKGCSVPLYLLSFYVEHALSEAGLVWLKTVARNTNNLRYYADDTISLL